MYNHADGFYEIEFQRLYKKQGRVLRRIYQLEKQLNCYENKKTELAALGVESVKLEGRIDLVQSRLNDLYVIRDNLEASKEEVSINKPNNNSRAIEAKIIAEAYERAYSSELDVLANMANCKSR